MAFVGAAVWRDVAGTVAAVLLTASAGGCVPLLTPHAEIRGSVGVAAGQTRRDVGHGARLTGTLDTVYLPTGLLACDREFDLGLGARFHFVEPEEPGVSTGRTGGLVSGAWYFSRGPFHRAMLRADLDALELDGRPMGGASLSMGIELFGLTEGAGAFFSWEVLGAGAWTGEVGARIEATIAVHDDFGGARYMTFTAGLTFRWPAGAGIAIINPFFLATLAANASSSSTPTTAPPPTSTTTPGASTGGGTIRTCEAPPEPASPLPGRVGAVDDAAEGLSEAAYRCRTDAGAELWFDTWGDLEAERACAEESGERCRCERGEDE